MLSAIIVIIGLSVLILIHEAGHFFAAKKEGLLVEEFGFGFPPRLYAWKRGETVYSLNWLLFGGFVKIFGERSIEGVEVNRGISIDPLAPSSASNPSNSRSFAHQSIWKRFVIIAAGISINFVFGWLLLSLVFMIGARQSMIITDVQPDSPAFVAGLKPGDELTGFKTPEEFVAYTGSHRGELVGLTITSEGQTRIVEVTPRNEVAPGEGALGVAVAAAGFERLGFFASLWEGLKVSVVSMAEIFKAFGLLIADVIGRAHVPENIVGPVGIFGIAGQLGSIGFVYLLQLIALISLNLAVLNFIPFPALDGGRLLFLVIEKIKGSPLNPKREFWANAISFGFLLLLMIVITVRDIVRLS